MSLATDLNQLAEITIPGMADDFPDRMDILEEETVAGTGGGRIKGASTEAYIDIPCIYEPMRTENRLNSADKLVSIQQYMITFPTHNGGFRIDIDPKKSQLRVLERGNEPEKIFRIVAIRDQMGVIFEAVCTKEN